MDDEGKGLAVDGTPLWDGYENDKDRELRRSYGMKLEHYNQLLELQGGVCAICKQPPPEGEYLRVDEDHDGWEIAGLLCDHDNKVITERRRRYIKNPPGRELGWTVPADRVEVRRKRNADRAQKRHEAKQQEQQAPPKYTFDSDLGSGLERLKAITRQEPADFSAPDPEPFGWTEPPPPRDPPTLPPRRRWFSR
jgi:hypothetical protein